MICNRIKLTVFLTVLILIFTSFFNPSFSIEGRGGLDYEANRFNYSSLDLNKLKTSGNNYFNQGINARRKFEREQAFNSAIGEYSLMLKTEPRNMFAMVQIARVYDMLGQDKLASNYFIHATNIEPNNARANYFYGEYYFKRGKLQKALKHYLISYKNGNSNDFNTVCRLGMTYEKLADLKNAKIFYQKAVKINPQKRALYTKIKNIDNANYESSEYYKDIRE